MSFTSSIWGKWRIWTIDRDRELSIDKLNELERSLKLDVESIRKMFLRNTLEKTTNQTLTKSGSWPWLIPYGIRNRTNFIGLHYCPVCFTFDSLPFYRKRWRFSWIVACPIHNVRLINTCNSCSRPIQPQKLEASARVVSICSFCGNDLSTARGDSVDKNELQFQKYLESLISNTEDSDIPKNSVSNTFELARFYISLIINARNTRRLMFRRLISLYAIDADKLTSPPSGIDNFDSLTASERSVYTSAAFKILEHGEDEFIARCLDSDVTQGALKSVNGRVPNILTEKSCLLKLVSKPSYKRKSSRRSRRHPSKENVLQAHNRILKKAKIKHKAKQ